MDRSKKLVYAGLLAVLALGAYLRLMPILASGTSWLADLDPYRNLRAVNEVVRSGHMPLFDPLSAPPNGTFATYSTSQGYYMFSAAFTLVSGLNSTMFLSISPVIYEVALLLIVYVFGSALTNSAVAGLFAAFFVAIPRGWSMIAIIGTCPLAENLGAVVFPLVLLLFWRYSTYSRPSFLVMSGLLLGISLLIHPITYFYLVLTILAFAVLMCLAERKGRTFIFAVEVLLISSFAFLLQFFSIKDFAYLSGFTRGALWLATLQPVYPVIDFYAVLYEVGMLVVFLSLMAIVLIFVDRKWNYLILVSSSMVMFSIIALSLVVPLRPFLADVPFSAFIILSHRVMMPYLPVVLGLLGGVFVAEYLLPMARVGSRLKLLASPKHVTVVFSLIAILVISIPLVQSSFAYANNYGWARWAQQYDPLFEWMKKNTQVDDIFVVNEISLGEAIRAIANRPTVFSLSYQDLATSDLVKRMWLQSSVFIEGYDDRIAQRLLYDFKVSYVVVVRNQYNVDILNKKYVFPAPEDSFPLYLKWMDQKPYLVRAYADPNVGFYIYHVQQEHLFKGEIDLPTVEP